MKRLFFFSFFLMSVVICGTAFAADLSGEYGYSVEHSDGSAYAISIAIKNNGNGVYSVTGFQQSISGVNHINKLEGTGKIINNILVVKGKIEDGFDTVQEANALLKIYSTPHPDLIKYGDEMLQQARNSTDQEMKSYYTDTAGKFRHLKPSQIAILSDFGFNDVCPKIK